MIVEFLLRIVFAIVRFVLDLLPSLPPMNSAIVSMGNYLVDMVSNLSQLLVYILGGAVFVATVALALALLLFNQIWSITQFIYAKLPINSR